MEPNNHKEERQPTTVSKIITVYTDIRDKMTKYYSNANGEYQTPGALAINTLSGISLFLNFSITAFLHCFSGAVYCLHIYLHNVNFLRSVQQCHQRI